jgi:hypothetical protein
MKSRLLACAIVAVLVVGTSIFVSAHVLAQGQLPVQGPQGVSLQNSQISAEIDKALEAYEERSGRSVDQCRKEMEQMKKELHELIDLRINMALAQAETRARAEIVSDNASRVQGHLQATKHYAGGNYPGAPSKSSPNAWAGNGPQAYSTALSNEVQQLHAQLRAEVDQQQNQVTQLVTQLRTLQDQLGPREQGSRVDLPKNIEAQKK